MNPAEHPHTPDNAGARRAGNLTVGLGVLALAATGFAYVLSLTDLIDPPNWIRIAGLVWLPGGLFGAPIAFVFTLRGPGRHRAVLGLGVAGVALAAFVVLLFVAG